MKIERVRRHTDMLLATAFRYAISNIEAGNISQALAGLRLMQAHYRSLIDH